MAYTLAMPQTAQEYYDRSQEYCHEGTHLCTDPETGKQTIDCDFSRFRNPRRIIDGRQHALNSFAGGFELEIIVGSTIDWKALMPEATKHLRHNTNYVPLSFRALTPAEKKAAGYTTSRTVLRVTAEPETAASQKRTELLGALDRVSKQDGIPPVLASEIADDLLSECHDFHSGEPLPEGCQNWRETRSARLLHSDTVKIDAVYRKRAERHVREMVKFASECQEVEAYLARDAA